MNNLLCPHTYLVVVGIHSALKMKKICNSIACLKVYVMYVIAQGCWNASSIRKKFKKNNWFFTLRANSSTSKTCTFTSLPTFLYYHTLSFCPLHLSSIPGPKLDPCVRKGASNAITMLYYSVIVPYVCTTTSSRNRSCESSRGEGGHACFQSLWPSHSKEWPLK